MPKDHAPETLRVAIGQHSAAGRKPENQDFHGALVPEGPALAMKGVALAVADGISSSPVGHVAAETAVKSFLTDYYCTADAWSVKTAGQRVIAATNAWLHGHTVRGAGAADRDRGYVCTFSALILKGRQAHLFHAGDSRIFRLSGRSMEQLTEDHRVVLSGGRSHLARALGMAGGVEIDYRTLPLAPGDIYVLSTDGVHESLPPREMARIAAGAADLETAAREMVAAALAAGSGDNLTVQIVRIEALPEAAATDFMGRADALPVPPLPGVPSTFDGFRIVRRLHANSRSHVFLALPADGGPPVALKMPSVDRRDDPDYLRRFVMEEWIARRVASPHLLKAAPAPAERRALYVVTEYVEGQTLRQWMTDNPRPDLETVRGLVEQIARGLEALHRREMLHQDLRPENVMLDRDGTVKIIDFGATRVPGVLEAAPGLTDDGSVPGTLQYAAPEYFLGDGGTWRSDLYSLGVLTYEMLTGRLPYGPAVSRLRRRRDLARLRYASARVGRERLPEWVDAALCRAVHPDPLKRQEALTEFTAGLRRPAPGAAGPPRAMPLLERDPVLFWKATALLLGVTVFLLLGLRL